MAIDTYYSDVSLLLLGRGANGSTTIVDNSPTPKTVTAFNGAAISTAWAKYGTGSLGFDGVNDYITVDHSAQLALGGGDFAIDVLGRSTSVTGDAFLLSKKTQGVAGSYVILRGANALVFFASSNGTTWDIANAVPIATITAGADFNIAVNRTGTAWKTYSNGVLTSSFTSSATVSDSGSAVFLGADAGAAGFFAGNLIVRITKFGRYPAAYTPDTEEFSDRASSIAALVCPAPLVSGGSLPASATATITAPSATSRGFGGANAKAVMPMAATVGYGGANAALTVSIALQGAGHDSFGDNAAFIRMPTVGLSAFGGGNGRAGMPMGELVASGTGTVLAVATLTAPAARISATGTGGGVASASLSISDRFTLIGYGGGIARLNFGSFSVNATGTGGSVGKAALTLPMFELSATAKAQSYGGGNLLMPSPKIGSTSAAWLVMPGVSLVAIGSAVVVAAYEAYAVNLKHNVRRQGEENAIDEVTRYTNFPFTHVVRYQNSYFGAAADGLYLLEGTTDNGAVIPYAIRTAVDDFGASEKKTMASAYFGGRLGPNATINVFAGETGSETYSYDTPRGQGAQNHREKFGRGVKNRYFALGVSGTGVMELDDIKADINKLTRKI